MSDYAKKVAETVEWYKRLDPVRFADLTAEEVMKNDRRQKADWEQGRL